MNSGITFYGILIMAMASFFGGGCDGAEQHSASVPKPQSATQPDKPAAAGETREAVFAGGCFWCIEAVFEELDGVKTAVSGYAGGTKDTANYELVCTGRTGHAEAVRVTYDPAKITYADLLHVFFTAHDPTTKDRQGPDAGTQYRSAIFYVSDEQKQIAEAYIKQLNEAKVFPAPIVTQVVPLKPADFYAAEDYHQNYVACHLRNPYVVQEALPKLEKIRDKFKSQLKPAATQGK